MRNWQAGVSSIVIHEVNQEERVDLLKKAASVADRIIIGDYLVPRPEGFAGFLSEVIEFIAGTEHYRNYKSYMSTGGIYHLAEQSGLKITNDLTDYSPTNHIIVMEK